MPEDEEALVDSSVLSHYEPRMYQQLVFRSICLGGCCGVLRCRPTAPKEGFAVSHCCDNWLLFCVQSLGASLFIIICDDLLPHNRTGGGRSEEVFDYAAA